MEVDERLNAWDLQDVSEYAQEFEPVDQLDGENDYETTEP